MRLFVLARHGQSELNVTQRVNGDPSVPVAADLAGRRRRRSASEPSSPESRSISAFTRASVARAQTAEIALAGRDVPLEVEPLLDDIYVGELEGKTIDDYRAWKRAHTRADAFPGGESLDDAARRYARAYERLLARPEQRILVVCHEIPVRYAVNAASGSDELDGPAHEIAQLHPAPLRRGRARARRGAAIRRRAPILDS